MPVFRHSFVSCPRCKGRSKRIDREWRKTSRCKNPAINSFERQRKRRTRRQEGRRETMGARSKFAERLGVIVESGGRNLSFGGTSDGRRSRVPIVARSRRMVAAAFSRDPRPGRVDGSIWRGRRRPLTRRRRRRRSSLPPPPPPPPRRSRRIFDLEADLQPRRWCTFLSHTDRQSALPSSSSSLVSSLWSLGSPWPLSTGASDNARCEIKRNLKGLGSGRAAALRGKIRTSSYVLSYVRDDPNDTEQIEDAALGIRRIVFASRIRLFLRV